jgi:hypothetical protein
MKKMLLEEMIGILAKHRKELERKYGVRDIGIYGSYIRGEQKEDSDLDMVIEFKDENSLKGLEYIGLITDLEEYLEKVLGIRPHLASKRDAMSSDKWKGIEQEIVYVFRGSLTQEDVKMILEEFKEYVKEILPSKFVELILYGSYARGDYEFGSDVDVLLLVKEKLTKKERARVSIKASELSLKYNTVISCFVYIYQAYETWETPFLMNVRSEGIKI